MHQHHPSGLLPASITPAEYRALHPDTGRWTPVLKELAETHGLGQMKLRPITEGSNLVGLLDAELVIKLFPPFMRHQYESEWSALIHLQGRLTTPIPEIIHRGERSGWPYLVMTQLEGLPLSAIWESCAHAEKCAILSSVGRLIAEVQSVPPGPLLALEPAWDAFMAAQARGCRSRHTRLGLPQHLLDGIDSYLAQTAGALPARSAPVILTGEYTPGNLLMRRSSGEWEIAGLIDFGDVMVGFSEYDLLGPGTFLAAGDARQLRALLSGFGYADASVDPGLRHRLMRMLLLHRYSNLEVQVRILGWQQRVQSLDELEQLVWPPMASGDGS